MLHWHDLRYGFVRTLVQNWIGLYKEQQLLGHKSLVMPQRIAHYSAEIWNGVESLDGLRGGSTEVAPSEAQVTSPPKTMTVANKSATAAWALLSERSGPKKRSEFFKKQVI